MSNSAFSSSAKVDPDLPLSADGCTYHITCKTANLADRIILVGDPGRVQTVADYFDDGSISYTASHREINIITGAYRGVPVSVLSTGMGTDNVEIVLNEIHILKEYDVSRHAWRPRVGEAPTDAAAPLFDPSAIKLIRVGTCGSPNDEIQVGSLAITRYAVGMDNTCQYYSPPAVNETPDVLEVLKKLQSTSLSKVQIYATKAAPVITTALVDACKSWNAAHDAAEQQGYYVGTTCSASGFYACQGRSVGRFRGRITAPELTEELGDLRFAVSEGEERVANIEMENSALCYLSNCLGYQAGTVCVVIARRTRDGRAFASPEQTSKALSNAITIALDAVTTA